ncbi:Histone deacetylase complex subunit SAP30 Sin3 binding domain-containing protein [Plasmodiophora brassicae]|nr:hypothetical protein PBRA_006663 [Plasmodiophora brassicae]
MEEPVKPRRTYNKRVPSAAAIRKNEKIQAAAAAAAAAQGGLEPKRKKLRSEDVPYVAVDFAKLEMNSLKAYRKHFKLETRPNAPKIELVNAATKHFATMPKFRETEVISAFLQKIRRERATRESLKIANQIRS